MSSIQLTDPAAGAFFAVPAADWTAISKRVGLTRLAAGIAPVIGRYLRDFPKLEDACGLWAASTFPGLVSLSQDIGSFAGQAADSLGSLQDQLSQYGPGDTLSAATVAAVKAIFATLAGGTQRLNSQSGVLRQQVQTFATENEVVDAQIGDYVKHLGPEWQSLTSELPAVETAAGLVEGAWGAIADDMNAIATDSIPITTALLVSLELQSAALAWRNLGPEAAAFATLAQGQQQYLSGVWLESGVRGQ
jgi:uncharacterized protein YdbL (DUF1318 family)